MRRSGVSSRVCFFLCAKPKWERNDCVMLSLRNYINCSLSLRNYIYGSFFLQLVANQTSSRSVYVYNLTTETTYEFSIQAIGSSGLSGPFSVPIVVQTLGQPGAPVSLEVSAFDRNTSMIIKENVRR